MNVKLYNQSAEEVGSVDLPDRVFGLKWNAGLVHQVVEIQRANRRPKVAHAKTRGEVRGGGRKPWRQKGTGRARHGSIRSPIWKGGGVTHGPRVEKNFKRKLNRKMARKALYTVLSEKLRDKEVFFVDKLSLEQSKTKEAARLIKNFSSGVGLGSRRKILLALAAKETNLDRAFRNIPKFKVEEARNLTAYDILGYRYLILAKAAIETFK